MNCERNLTGTVESGDRLVLCTDGELGFERSDGRVPSISSLIVRSYVVWGVDDISGCGGASNVSSLDLRC